MSTSRRKLRIWTGALSLAALQLCAPCELNLGSLLLGPPVLSAQTPDTTRMPSAGMLERVAEAVDGTHSGAPIYVVVDRELPHRVVGTYESRTAAENGARLAAESTSRHVGSFEVFGPYRTASARDIVMLCQHDRLTSVMEPNPRCPPELGYRFDQIESLAIILRLRNGKTVTYPLDRTTDAVFLSIPALDKFAMPYYTRVIGVDEAAALRQRIVDKLPQP